MKRILPRLALAVCLCLAVGLSVNAQTWPSRPITLVVGFGAGGNGDATARIFAEFLARQLGQPVIVENRAGGGGIVAALDVSKAAPNGYTILVQAIGPAILRPLMDPSAGYDSVRDFSAIGLLSESPNVILGGSKFPARSLQELVDWAKKNPGQLTVGHPGPGTMGHLGALLLASQAGITGTYIAYRSGGHMLPDLLGGQIDAGCAAYAPSFKSSNILAVMTAEPIEFLPGVPSMREAGFPNVIASTWYGVFGPPHMPPEIVTKLNAAMNVFLQSEEARSRFPGLGVRPLGGPPEGLTRKMVEDKIVWSKIIDDGHLKMDAQK
jgi:tripartite-type tricarboxylate transporter receptor subunit TctC